MIRFIRAAAVAAIAILGLSLGVVLGPGTAQAAITMKSEGGPGIIVVTVTGGKADANCMATASKTTGTTTDSRTMPLNLNDKGNGATTFTDRSAGKYDVVVQCPGTKKFKDTATVTAPAANPCVTLVRDIAMGLGLAGAELNTVIAIARQYCPQ